MRLNENTIRILEVLHSKAKAFFDSNPENNLFEVRKLELGFSEPIYRNASGEIINRGFTSERGFFSITRKAFEEWEAVAIDEQKFREEVYQTNEYLTKRKQELQEKRSRLWEQRSEWERRNDFEGLENDIASMEKEINEYKQKFGEKDKLIEKLKKELEGRKEADRKQDEEIKSLEKEVKKQPQTDPKRASRLDFMLREMG